MKLKLYSILIFFIILSCDQPNIKSSDIESIKATSTLEQAKNKRYSVENLLSLNSKSWCEGESKLGIGSKIEIKFKTDVSLKSFYIRNGFGDPKYYFANARVNTLGAKFGDFSKDFHLGYGFELHKIDFEKNVKGKKLILTIKEATPGDKYNDTCINFISFLPYKDIIKELGGSTYTLKIKIPSSEIDPETSEKNIILTGNNGLIGNTFIETAYRGPGDRQEFTLLSWKFSPDKKKILFKTRFVDISSNFCGGDCDGPQKDASETKSIITSELLIKKKSSIILNSDIFFAVELLNL